MIRSENYIPSLLKSISGLLASLSWTAWPVHFCLLLLAFGQSTNAISQHWPMDNSTWYMNKEAFMVHPLTGVEVFQVTKDTAFENFQCKIVSNDSLNYIFCDSGTSQIFMLLNDSVYPWGDFSAGAGDTMSHFIRFLSYHPDTQEETDTFIVVESIVASYVFLNGQDTLFHFKRLFPIDSSMFEEFFTPPVTFDFIGGVGYFTESIIGFPFYPVSTNIYYPNGYYPPFPRCYSDSSLFWKNPYFLDYGIDDCAYEYKVGIEENPASPTINIWPNPVREVLYVGQGWGGSLVEIRSMDGRLVLHEITGNGKVDVSALPAGLYILNLNSNSYLHSKFIKL